MKTVVEGTVYQNHTATGCSTRKNVKWEPLRVSAMEKVLFIESGFGADQHGQNATKACKRACRNAIEFNSIPSIKDIVPGGYENMKLHVKIGCPDPHTVDVKDLAEVFPYGSPRFEVVEGGLRANSGICIAELGDANDEMFIAVACVTVGY